MRLVVRVGDSGNGPSGNPWGDGDLTFQLPFRSGYNYNCEVDWGDGTRDTITAWDDAALDHTYPAMGDYEIQISGLAETIFFDNTGDKDKVKDLAAFGKTGWVIANRMFYGCRNMVSTAGPVCDTSSVTEFSAMFHSCRSVTSLDVSGFDTSSAGNFSNMFYNCLSLTALDVSGFDTSSAGNLSGMFRSCSSLTALNVSGWDTSSVTTFDNMFRICSLLDPDISNFNISSLNNAATMMDSSAFSNANYDKMLLAWSAQTPAINNAVPFHAGSAQYTETAARDILDVTHSWDITDGGPA